MRKDIEIVGGGITGLTAGLYCKKRGIEYKIIEKEEENGGILRDWKVNGDWYYRNCQYLSAREEWFKLWPGEEFDIFTVKYGSYTDIWDIASISIEFAGPVYPNRIKKKKITNNEQESLAQRLDIYPEEISEGLTKWVNKLGFDTHEIHSSNSISLQISRILPTKDIDYIKELKKRERLADTIYGLSRKELGIGPDIGALPKNGYNQLFKKIGKELNIKNSTNYRNYANCQKESETKTDIIWTGNPTPLINNISDSRMNSPATKAKNVLIKIDKSIILEPFYIQVYAKNTNITRIFCYLNKITIEAINEMEDKNRIAWEARNILEKFSINIGKSIEVYEKREIRHFIISRMDYKVIKKFLIESENTALIPAAWHEYSRDSKINGIIKMVKSRHCV